MSISTIFEQSSGQIDVPLPQLIVRKSCSLSASHGICLAQLIGREIGHGAADGAEVEDAAGVLGELYSVEGSALDGAFDLGWFPVGELGEPYVPGDQTSSCISSAVAFVMFVIRPRALGALGKDEPVFNMVSCRHPVQPDLLVACHMAPVLSPGLKPAAKAEQCSTIYLRYNRALRLTRRTDLLSPPGTRSPRTTPGGRPVTTGTASRVPQI